MLQDLFDHVDLVNETDDAHFPLALGQVSGSVSCVHVTADRRVAHSP